jgi:general secretion pathway protein D
MKVFRGKFASGACRCLAMIAVLTVAACESESGADIQGLASDVHDLSPHGAAAQNGGGAPAPLSKSPSTMLDQAPPDAPVTRSQIFEGADQLAGREQRAVRTKSGDISLDFADADVRDVTRSVLGDMLQLQYVINAQVSGHITLKTGAPIAKSAVLPAFETALKTAGAALVVHGDTYEVVPLTEAQKQTSVLSRRAGEAGYGVEIVPLHFIAAEQMEKILSSLVPTGSVVNVDMSRNLLFLAGTEPDRASMRDTIAMFDVDYLKSMSYAIIQPVHVDADTLAAELDKVFEGTGSPISGVVRLIPISRINALLVVSSRAAYLREVSTWVNRLDVTPVEPGRRLYYYRLQNARAADIAQTISQLYGGSAPRAAAKPSGSAAQAPSMLTGTGAGGGLTLPPMAQAPPEPAAGAPPVMGGGLPGASSANGPQIVTDEANNALIIRADQGDYASIERVIREMDVAPQQVMIEATIAEVTLNKQLQYGVEWYFKSGFNGAQSYTFSQNGQVTNSFPGFGFSYAIPNVQATLSALGTLSHVTIVASPKVLTLDNKAASLEVGSEVPIVSQTSVSTNDANAPLVSTVQMQSTGVILSVTPRIGKSGMVFLDVSQEVSDAIPTTTSTINSPTIEERRVQATVGIRDGQTIALGGLIQSTDTKSDSGIPYLKDIPILGNLANTVDNQLQRTELLIFLTPHVIHDPAEAASMTDQLARSLDDVRKAMEEEKKARD